MVTEPTDALLPCPFCGSPDAVIADDLVTFNGLCNACGASGGYGSYRNGAAWLWNRRTPPAQVAEPVATQWLAEMIMSDCGCSTENQRLLDRIIDRIQQYDRANTAPQPVAREPLSHAQAKALVLKYGNDPLHLVLQVERHHGIKGGQHVE